MTGHAAMSRTATIWFASGNAHKKAELAAILGTEVLIPADVGLDFDPEETGTTFHDNALLKARALYELLENSRATGRPPLYKPGDPIIADDSGLCVDALDGRPGIFSARYAGKGAPHGNKKLQATERNALLLDELGDSSIRTARFVCAMALLFSPSRFYVVQETFEGEIVAGKEAIKGIGGFGYDPIVYIPELERTVAELSEAEKNTMSHRAKAGKIIAALLNARNAKELHLIAKT